MTRLARRFFPALLLACVAAGCDSPFGPQDVAGTYVLERVGSAPLPAVIGDTDYGTFTILSDTVRLGPDGTGSDVQVIRVERHEAGAPATTETSRNSLGYHVRGDHTIEIGYSCGPPNTLCALINSVPALNGHFTSDGLVIDYPEPYVFRRID